MKGSGFFKIKKPNSDEKLFKKLGSSMLLPVLIMIIAGIIRGIGLLITGIENTQDQVNSAVLSIGTFIDSIGNICFTYLPVFFALSVAITFTKIKESTGYSTFIAVTGYLVFTVFQSIFIKKNGDNGNYNILYYHDVNPGLVVQMFGTSTLQTSVLSGILFGILGAYLVNKFGEYQMPRVLQFFSGPGTAILLMFPVAFVVAMLFVLIWPALGWCLIELGNSSGKLPAGLDSFTFGYFERALIPTGLNNVLNLLFIYTPAGGTLNGNFKFDHGFYNNGVWFTGTLTEYLKANNLEDLLNELKNNGNTISGDFYIWFFIQKTGIPFTVFAENGLKAGRFLNGRYPFMLFGMMGAALAMILASAASERKKAVGLIGSAAAMTFLTGTTQPLEFTFVFVAPWLFFGVHALLAAICWMLMNVLGCHAGLVYSGGIIDLSLYAIMPDVLGLGTNSWVIPIIGAPMFVIYFIAFYAFIVKFNVITPGREKFEGLSKEEIKKLNENILLNWYQKVRSKMQKKGE